LIDASPERLMFKAAGVVAVDDGMEVRP